VQLATVIAILKAEDAARQAVDFTVAGTDVHRLLGVALVEGIVCGELGLSSACTASARICTSGAGGQG
jgi:hypothetical protein